MPATDVLAHDGDDQQRKCRQARDVKQAAFLARHVGQPDQRLIQRQQQEGEAECPEQRVSRSPPKAEKEQRRDEMQAGASATRNHAPEKHALIIARAPGFARAIKVRHELRRSRPG